MRLLDSMRSRAASLFQRSQINAEMEEELRSHIQHRADDLERSGLHRPEAERRARIEFGGREKYKEEIHEALGSNYLGSLLQDVRVSLRTLRKSPGFAFAAILTLSFAIGANAVVFAVLNALILRPLDVPRPQSLYQLQHGNEASGYESYPDYLDLRDRNHSFDGLAALTAMEANLDAGENPSRTWGMECTGNLFDTLGLQPYLGRFFHASDEHGPNSAPYIVLSYAYWQNHFQSDRGVVGRVVQVDKRPYTILGVAPREFHGLIMFFNPDFFVPLVNSRSVEELNARDNRWVFLLFGHLKDGVTPAQATADLDSIGSDLEKAYPKVERKMTFALVRPNLYGDYLGRPVRAFMTALMLLAGLILLAACANLGGLFAARAADRSREVALRLALGSTRRRILRGLLIEALMISLAGGALGLLGSVVLLRELSAWQPFARWPIHLEVNPDAKVYLVALFLALLSGLLFGAVPVKQVLATNPYEVVKSGSTGRAGRRVTLRDVLLVAQIAICAVLVTSSMVAVRGLARSLHGDFGFRVENTLLADTELSMAAYHGDRVAQMQKSMVKALEAIPGVESVGLADNVPLGDGADETSVFTDDTTDLRPSNASASLTLYRISPEYFHAAGTAIVSGRTFTWQDDKESPRVAVVNTEFARKMFGSATTAMGRHFKMPDGSRIQVVGIAEDGKYGSLTEDQLPVVFLPILQSPSTSTWLVVRTNRDRTQLTSAIRNAVRELDPGLPIFIQPWFNEMDTILFGPRMATISLGVLGVLGALLSVTGIFGMAAYSVSKRLRELGIRIALGAKRGEVLQAALGRPLKLLAFGSAAGLLLGLLGTRVLAFIVYQATPRDPLVLAGVVLAMALLGLLATWIPAQRALSVNPMILLREE
jgi:predicted permease